MDPLGALAQQIEQLRQRHDPGDGNPRDGPDLQELSALVREVRLVVPSLLAVSLVRTRSYVPVPLVLLAPVPGSAQAQASLAVALPSPPGTSALLVLQAADPGAFLLLVDQLQSRPLPGDATLAGPVAELDQHLTLPGSDAGVALAAALADLSLVDRATGVLIERGLLPAAAVASLRGRARSDATSVPDASRAVLAETAPRDGGSYEP